MGRLLMKDITMIVMPFTYSVEKIAGVERLSSGDDDEFGYPDVPGDVAVEPAKPQLEKPKLYKVILINDDYTPMGFVVQILMQVFGMDEGKASSVMLEVHQRGKGVCGIYPREIAETKVMQVSEYAKKNEHPLLCVMEEA